MLETTDYKFPENHNKEREKLLWKGKNVFPGKWSEVNKV